MPKSSSDPSSVDAYIDGLAGPARDILLRLVAGLRAGCPDLHESVSYKMPTFRRGKNHVFLGAFTHHIGLYGLGPVTVPALSDFANDKGNYSFPLKQNVPEADILSAMLAVLTA